MKIPTFNEIQVIEDHSFDAVGILRDFLPSPPVADVEEALYVCDLTNIVEKMRIWREKMPRVHPFYAVKCNDDSNVLRLLMALGAGFDCASKVEIKKVLDLGVSPSDIIFANPCKPSSHLKYASQKNVPVMTFDSAIELHKIKQYYPTAKVVLRIRCDAKKAQCPLGDKFGCDPKKRAPSLMAEVKNLGLDLIGISFHVGSGCCDPPVFRKAISAARNLFDYAKTLGFEMSLLDLGGGYPGDKGTDISEIAKIVNEALDDFFPDPSVQVIAEPGRFFVASAFTLATTIHSKNEILEEDGNVTHVKYYVNDGVYGSFNCQLYDHQVVVPRLLRTSLLSDELQDASIWGPTCDALDKICDGMKLPCLAINDVIYFENMGAYTLPVASPFNGFPVPKVVYFIDETIWNEISTYF